ncbi:MAG: 3-dehydroquinate synthase [Dehalococcoidia bacterium]|nr:3-dehydroquinate synthase [Dehalococcoidia bacterium]
MAPECIVLVGLSGSGKSTVGPLVARRLGWAFTDTDALIEQAAGRSIPELFAEEGEARFREREQAALRDAIARHRTVVSTGGGAPTTPGGRAELAQGFTVWLVVSPARAAARLAENPATPDRPLLAGDALGRLESQLDARRRWYELADAAVDVDYLSPEQAADEIVRLWAESRGHAPRFGHENAARGAWHVAATVQTPGATYPIVVEPGVLDQLGSVCRETGLTGRAFVVTDTGVGPLFGQRAMTALAAGDFETARFEIPAGEEQKTMATVGRVHDWLLGQRVERSDFVVCVGGGVVTDLAGFAAATTLRGIDFVHVPTTLLGMVDASVGGKTGVDHAMGKNLIGAFAQPRAVVIDPEVLKTLPERQRRAGWAEVVKHGLILDPRLVEDLEKGATDPLAMLSPELIGRSVAIKAEVVSEDEKEAGRRTLLNYGHTIGHAIEAVTGYSAYLHGEAVAVGMHAAGRISVAMGLLSAEELERQQRLITAYGLPDRAPGLDPAEVIAATASDKKVRSGRIKWVLLEGIGRAATRNDVPDEVVREALAGILG